MRPDEARSAAIEITPPVALRLALERGERANSPLQGGAGDAAVDEESCAVEPEGCGDAKAEPGPFQDLPGWIWLIFLGGWTAFFGQLLVFFTTSRMATFMVVVSALFAIFAFGLVFALAAQGRTGRRPSSEVIHTHSGELSAGAAAAQVALIPVAVAIGLAAFILLAL